MLTPQTSVHCCSRLGDERAHRPWWNYACVHKVVYRDWTTPEPIRDKNYEHAPHRTASESIHSHTQRRSTLVIHGERLVSQPKG
jgi:hypothetical protein